jgi:hypothetical protein
LRDPAYDLAIVTRGARRPFRVEGGMDKLWDTDALARKSIQSPAQQLKFLKSVLAKLETRSGQKRANSIQGAAERTESGTSGVLSRLA